MCFCSTLSQVLWGQTCRRGHQGFGTSRSDSRLSAKVGSAEGTEVPVANAHRVVFSLLLRARPAAAPALAQSRCPGSPQGMRELEASRKPPRAPVLSNIKAPLDVRLAGPAVRPVVRKTAALPP